MSEVVAAFIEAAGFYSGAVRARDRVSTGASREDRDAIIDRMRALEREIGRCFELKAKPDFAGALRKAKEGGSG